MAIDNRDTPTLATCDGPSCTATLEFDGINLRQAQRDLVAAEWFWYVDYTTVHTHCPLHPADPRKVNQ